MSPIQKALRFVEAHLAQTLTLEDVARHCGVSPFHLTRGFAAVTGCPMMKYVRVRRLSEAARELSGGAPNILSVALEAGYGSHEAFTRAFRDQFGLTPEQVREQRGCGNLTLVEPITMDSTPSIDLAKPRFVTSTPMLLAGLSAHYNCASSAGIPGQWQRLTPFIGSVAGQVGNVAYGASYNFDDDGNFDYLCGVEVKSFSDLPGEFAMLRVPAQAYAVFHQPGHITTIRQTCASIWSKWLPQSGSEAADAPLLERYGPEFDPVTGNGGFEIWFPVKE
jgi:AraC family transcriptional regulator